MNNLMFNYRIGFLGMFYLCRAMEGRRLTVSMAGLQATGAPAGARLDAESEMRVKVKRRRTGTRQRRQHRQERRFYKK